MIMNNFLYRVRDWIGQNRVRLIKYLLIIAAVIASALLIYYAFERYNAWRYEKNVQALDRRFRDAEDKAKAAEALINALKVEIGAKDALIAELDKQAAASQRVVERTRTEYVFLKGVYEKTRDNPDVPVDISDCNACAELARAGHACK